MKRVFQKSPPAFHLLGALFFLVFSLTGAKVLIPGEIVLQEGVFYRTEGLQLQKMGELDRAAAAFRQAVYLKPDYAEAYNDLGVVLESLGDLDEAEEVYKTALKFKPDLGSAHSNLALLYEESGRVQQAAAHWGARVRLGPPEDPWVAAARQKLTKYQLPVPETYEGKVRKKDKEIRRMIQTGKAHLEAKRWDKAIEEFEQVLQIDPAHAEAIRLLRSARTRAAQTQGRQVRELEAAKGRVTEEARRIEAESRAERAAKQTKVKWAEPEVSPALSDAQALAREIVREKSKVRGKASDDLVRRAAVAMREGLYQDAIEIYEQILILEPGNQSAKQGLERAQKAFAKQL